jgi:hypothetical protein
VIFSTRRIGENCNARRDTACTRSAASSVPAPLEESDTTMMSAGATGSLTTSASCGSQNAFPNRGKNYDDGRSRCDHLQD